MKRAVILHGTDGSPSEHWLPWMKSQLEKYGYAVFTPLLPDNHSPDHRIYEDYLKESGWDFEDNLLVGHSSGATTVLNLLSSDWFPHVEAVVLVGTFLNEKLTKTADWYDPGQFDNLFLDSYEPSVLKQKAGSFYFVHGSNDPFCDIQDAKELCKKLEGDFITIENGHHLGDSSGITELTELTRVMQKNGLLE